MELRRNIEALFLSKINFNQYPYIYAEISSSLESSRPKFHLHTTKRDSKTQSYGGAY
jgi:hypothetical protein